MAKRNYKEEYRKFQSSIEDIRARAKRNAARRKAQREGRVSKGDGKEVHHVNGNPMDNSEDNLRVVSRKYNREEANRKA
jgi:hypothetical protein|tara:strand:- start:1142 stop:1378 length:237 start_codon:yes stop_codon:yes gene_type:complete